MVKRKPLDEAALTDDFDLQAVQQLRGQLNLPTVQPNNSLTVATSQPSNEQQASTSTSKPDRVKKINIDIGERRHNRLTALSAQIRGNNDTPVPPAERMYPIHLIQIAIDHLLDGVNMDWNEIRNSEDLKEALNRLSNKP